jgi:tetraacyldisaccharide-1-P 4'-kinase
MLLSGIGTPKSFERTVEKAGLRFEEHLCMEDHYGYTQGFVDKYSSIFGKYDYVLTTEKDYTKLKALKIGGWVLVVRVVYLVDGLF